VNFFPNSDFTTYLTFTFPCFYFKCSMISVSNDHGRPQGGNGYLLHWNLGLRTFKAFCQRLFALKRISIMSMFPTCKIPADALGNDLSLFLQKFFSVLSCCTAKICYTPVLLFCGHILQFAKTSKYCMSKWYSTYSSQLTWKYLRTTSVFLLVEYLFQQKPAVRPGMVDFFQENALNCLFISFKECADAHLQSY